MVMKKDRSRHSYFLVTALLLLTACSSSPDNEESIRKQISTYQQQVTELNAKIAGLEKQLAGSSNPGTFQVPVKVSELHYGPFNHFIEVSGSAEAVSDAYISPEVSGQVREILVDEGAHVQRGQLLARLNTEITQSTIGEVKSQLDLANVVFEKQARLWEKGIGSEIQYLNAKTNKEALEKRLETLNSQMDMAIIKSPVNGIVDEIFLKKGELALPGAQLMRIVNLDEIFINADVSEVYLPVVRQGDTVNVEFPVFPDLDVNVPIYRKGNTINPNNRTFPIQLRMSNPRQLLKPNLLSVIHINDFSTDSALTVPSIIIKQDIRGSYLYVAASDTNNKLVARKVYIETGASFDDRTMVTEGLESGLKVIVEGYNQVSDGSEIAVKPEDVS